MGLAEDMEKLNQRFPCRWKHERATLWMRFEVLLSQYFGYIRTWITHTSQNNYTSYREHIQAIQVVVAEDFQRLHDGLA